MNKFKMQLKTQMHSYYCNLIFHQRKSKQDLNAYWQQTRRKRLHYVCTCLHSCLLIYSFKGYYLLSSFYRRGTILEARDTVVNKIPCRTPSFPFNAHYMHSLPPQGKEKLVVTAAWGGCTGGLRVRRVSFTFPLYSFWYCLKCLQCSTVIQSPLSF